MPVVFTDVRIESMVQGDDTMKIHTKHAVVSNEAIEQYVNIVNDKKYTDFPFRVIHVGDAPFHGDDRRCKIMHWHEDLQFMFVKGGYIEVQTLDEVYRIESNEGVFINKNVVHYIRQGETCNYCSFVFPEHMLRFYDGSPAKSVVEEITHNEQIQVIRFTQSETWQGEVLLFLQRLEELSKQHGDEQETSLVMYEILVCLTSLWLCLRRNVKVPPRQGESMLASRMQVFLQYIEMHYSEPVTLEAIAHSVNVSKSECLRCFKASLHTTPYKYLQEFRLEEAIRLLKHTDESIGSIASSVGFQEAGHFAKSFKAKMGMSPRAFRKQLAEYRQDM